MTAFWVPRFSRTPRSLRVWSTHHNAKNNFFPVNRVLAPLLLRPPTVITIGGMSTELRKVIYSTNAIEAASRQARWRYERRLSP
ncbi:MAG: hypothetical protein V3V08_08720 [Nannocystaceae bacterium]